MDNYKKLLEEINLFLNNEEINSINTNTEIISLYFITQKQLQIEVVFCEKKIFIYY